ncbi:MAG: Na+/H+ antiporter NhaA [Bacteroidetes bacterium]|nr:Na+/H+ antiporter NhaA [Bacteroidota bacterium]
MNKYIISPIREFTDDSRAAGIVLLCCTIVSLWLSNTSPGPAYTAQWNKETLSSTILHLPGTPLHIINDVLMVFFFLLAGMEIKRELLVGELSSLPKSLLPIFAALGGMLVPAFIYFLFCRGTVYSNGWGIPMATDIAFSLGVLSLLGKRAPLSIRILLMALAIIDDLGGIITIAAFYSTKIDLMFVILALLVLGIMIVLNKFRVQRVYPYAIGGILLWYFVYNSGIHATIAGVLIALCIPMNNINRYIHSLHDPVNFLVLPLFALANTAIILPANAGMFQSPVMYGVIFGLLIGKPLGIFTFSRLAIKLKFGSLPARMNGKQLLGMSMVAGIGFTISIFMATLAFDNEEVSSMAKVAVIIASVVSGIVGYAYLRFIGSRTKKAAGKPAAE